MRSFLMTIGLLISTASIALESTKPPHPLNTFSLTTGVVKELLQYSHYRIIGSCIWSERAFPPKIKASLAVSQFLPDLVVTVSNNPDENPWTEAGLIYENKAARLAYQGLFAAALGLPLGFGDDSGLATGPRLNDSRTRLVHVIGSPTSFFQLPFLSHRAETQFGLPYYSSTADAVIDRTESGELLYMVTHPYLIGKDIGTFYHSWGPEIPRLMRVNQPSRFRASVVAAMHAADIVTNEGLHVKHSTTNRCGPNCIVANVIYDPDREKVIWQEVYPNNRQIHPGDPEDFGEIDDADGNGNYVFVVWRKYRGCIQQKGKLLWGSPKVGEPQKR